MIIVLEGPDGAGKTTLAKQLHQHYTSLKYETLIAYHPEGYRTLKMEEQFAAIHGILICDREAKISGTIYRNALPDKNWETFKPPNQLAFLDEGHGVVVKRFLLSPTFWENDNPFATRMCAATTEYSLEEYKIICEQYKTYNIKHMHRLLDRNRMLSDIIGTVSQN